MLFKGFVNEDKIGINEKSLLDCENISVDEQNENHA